MRSSDKYEAVIGLEVHVQLSTSSKLFCGDSTEFGAEPNTQISAITLAHPGTLPRTNELAIQSALKLGLSLGCDVVHQNYFARKNYFYPDLPKGYQLSQHTTPICKGGEVKIETAEGDRHIKLNRIHIEEDAGKSLHDLDESFTCIDLNRAGTCLLEIVTEPDIHSSEEAFAYVTELRKLVRFLGISDGNMEEGSMRCDANISVRLRGETNLGTKVEVKNLNSIRNIRRAIDVELDRLVTLLENGERVVQQTRSYDASNNSTFALRSKEEANDYRYFPDPDLPPFVITKEKIKEVRDHIPMLPAQLEIKYVRDYGLTVYDARQLCEDRDTSILFESVVARNGSPKAVANWIIGPVRSYCNEHELSIAAFPLTADKLAQLVHLAESGTVNFNVASSKLMLEVIKGGGKDPLETARSLNLLQESADEPLQVWVEEVIKKMPDKVAEYKKGKKALIGLFAGEVKKLSKGKADMQKVTSILKEKLLQS
jgi:aspartyl-tRNA(Asn)/glutamyl-tRNA(Gln) amidotransferase subunit B